MQIVSDRFAVLVILVNLLTDLAYTFLDPRVQLG
jgi:ABC-type dipeptide/oligopeptide/nickel transport system permease component